MKRILQMTVSITGTGRLLKYTVLGILSGLCSFLFINAVTRVVGEMIAGKFQVPDWWYTGAFAVIILLFVWTRRVLSLAIIRLSQTLFWDLRREILSLVLKSGYRQLTARKTEVHAAMVNDVNVMTNASLFVINFFTSFILSIACLVYLASISLILFGITLVVALLGVGVYHFSTKKEIESFQRSRDLETTFQGHFNSVLDGFKEIYMDPGKGKSIYQHKVTKVAGEAYDNNMYAYTGFLNNQLTGQVLFYILIAVILLFISTALHIPAAATVSFVFTLLYLLGSIETIMVLLPQLARARVASDHLIGLKQQLEKDTVQHPVTDNCNLKDNFEQIDISRLEYYYGEKDSTFGIGPVDLQVRKGDVLFIYGGNGSGKTTFVHTVLGLNIPTAGEIRCNNVVIGPENYPHYRALFAVVFSDFYLFNEVLGIDQLNREKWASYLRLFELEDKVKLEADNTFSTTDLSAGQRKRLALIAALLEEKPVLVLDEWAADQDPYFRKKFYTEIIPILKEQGLTIIAITHDDKYYHCADKLYQMDYGKLMEEQVKLYL